MQRRVLLIVVALAAAALVAVVPSGSAQAPGPTTLTLFEPEDGGTFRIVDNAPKSPSKNPESRKYRFSAGDQVIFTNPVLNNRGGTSQGSIYVKATVMKGKTFANVRLLAEGVILFKDGSQIELGGMFSFANSSSVRVAVTGGTGIYDGATGNLASTEVSGGSQDTITLK
jgi:hypothetical protein